MLRCPDCGARRDASGACPRHGAIAAEAAPLETLPPPPAIAGFTIAARIGAGAQGEIWAARRTSDGRDACIKLARPIGATKTAAWHREIDLQRRAGPVIAPEVLGVGTTIDGACWLAMARVPGDTLARAMELEPTPWSASRVADVLAPLLSCVDALHRAGIAHGDLKPENAFVRPTRAVLVDFGSACATTEPTSDPCAGTADYLAPERCTAGAVATIASDLYSIAVLAYELLAGAPPFWGPDELVIEAHRSRRAPALVRRGLPRALDDLLRRALAKDPRDRPRSAAAFADAWLPCLRAHGDEVARAPASTVVAAQGDDARRVRAALVWLESNGDRDAVHRVVAAHRGVLAHARGNRIVLAFPAQGTGASIRAAIAAARELLTAGACTRALVDIEAVGVRRGASGLHVLSPCFGFATRHPDAADPLGLAFTRAAAELAHEEPVRALPHRSDRVAAVEVVADPVPTPTEAPGLHGRAAIVDALRLAAAEAARGRPTLATVVGESGSGRSRIAAAIGGAVGPGMRVVALRGPEPGAATGSVGELVGHVLGVPIDGDARDHVAQALGTTADALPIGLLLALGWADPDDPDVRTIRAAPGAIRSSIAAAVADVLVRSAAARPLTLCIDDADRVEPALFDAIEAATLSERGAPLFAIVLGRPGLAGDRPTWGSRAGRSLALELGPLPFEASAALLRELLAPALNVSEDALAEMHRRTRGLPLLLVELAKALRDAGALQRSAGGSGFVFVTDVLSRVPDVPLAAWMAERELDRLPVALRRHAAVVAAMGPDSEPHALEATLARLDDDGDPLPTELDPEVAAQRLVAAGVVRRDANGLVFRHAALRDVAAGTLTEVEARRLHAAAHAVLADAVDPRVLAARLHHALGAGMRAAAAADAASLAADASRRHAYLEADRFHGIVLAHVEADDDAAIAALHGRALMRFRLGRYEEARGDLERVIAATGSVTALLDAATVEDWCESFPRAEALVEQAAPLALASGDPVIAARLALARGRVDFRRGRVEEAVVQLAHAVAAADALGDEAYETHVIALLLLAPLYGMTGHAERSLPLFDRLFELCRAHADRIHLATAHLNRPFVWMEIGRYDRMREDLAEVIAMSRAAGFPLLECRARYNLGEIAYLLGDLAEAERQADSLLQLQRQLGGDDSSTLTTELLWARTLARGGRLSEAAARTASIRARQRRASADEAARFELMASDEILCRMVELACGATDDATWDELVARSEADSVQQEHIEVLELAGLAAAWRGDRTRALSLLERALALCETTTTMLRPRIEDALRNSVPVRRVG